MSAVTASLLLASSPARASFEDFAGTFAGLAGVSKAEVVDGFNLVVEHGSCIPQYFPGDPEAYLLGALTVGLKVARSQGIIGKNFNQCNQQINLGNKALALVFSKSGKILGYLTAAQQQQLKAQAAGAVGGLPFLINLAECACAVAVTDTPIDAQIKVVKAGVETAWDIFKLGGKLVMAAGKVISSTGVAVVSVGKQIGCAMGLGGCSDFDAAKFFQVFKSMRGQGTTYSAVRAMCQPILSLGGLRSTSGYPDFVAECEASYQKALAAEREAADNANRLKVNQTIAAQAAAGWAIIWAKTWAWDCKDEQCASQQAVLANQRAAEEATPATLAYYKGSTTAMKISLNNKYNPRIKMNIAQSVGREQARQKIRDNPSAPPEQRLPLFSTTSYLGRAGEYLARTESGFGACANYARRAAVKRCYMEGQTKKSASWGLMIADLTPGCVIQPGSADPKDPRGLTSLIYWCGRPDGRHVCENYRLGGVLIACLPNPLPKLNARVAARPRG